MGLIQPDGAQHVLVRSPALLALVAHSIGAGLPADGALDLIHAETDPLRGDILRAAIEEIRVGAVADAAGTSSTGAAREDRQPAAG